MRFVGSPPGPRHRVRSYDNSDMECRPIRLDPLGKYTRVNVVPIVSKEKRLLSTTTSKMLM